MASTTGNALLTASGNIGLISLAQNRSIGSTTLGKASMSQSALQSSTAIGASASAGKDLTLLANAGSLVLEGSALAAGQALNVKVGEDLQLLTASSTRNQSVQSISKTSDLNAELTQTRQLLSTITAGTSATLEVGGNLSAQIGSTNTQGAQEADRMTAQGVVKGSDRQQVHVSGSTAGNSKMLGGLAAQGIRSGADDSFAPGAVLQNQAAVNALLQSGLISASNNPAIQGMLAKPALGPLTTTDASGKVQLTLAGQAQVQAVYNQLRLNETFTEHADAGTAQVASLVVAIALTVASGGSAAGIGMTMLGQTGAVTVGAVMTNAAVIGMASTMVGQLAGGASLSDAFEAGVKAGVTSGVVAGASLGIDKFVNGPATAAGSAPTPLPAGESIVQVGATGAGTGLTSLQRMGTVAYWEQTALNATVQGVVSKVQGGSFKDGVTGSVVGSLAATGAEVIGAHTAGQPVANVAAHAVLGCATAAAGGKDCASGAVGGATSALVAPLFDSALDGAGLSQATQNAVVAAGSVTTAAIVAGALDKDTVVAAGAAGNEVVNNYLTHSQISKLLSAIKACNGGSQADCAMRDQLFALDRQTTRDLKTACSGGTSDACTAQQQQVRDAYASILRADVTQNLPLGYGTYAADTRSQADSTFSMTDRTLGTVQGLASGVVGALAPFGNALGTAAAAVTGNTAAQADIQNFVSGTVDAVGKGLGMGAAAAMGNDMAQADLSQAYTSTKAAANNALQQHNNQLADAYQNGDAQTIGQINGTIAGTIMLAIPGGIVGTTGKAADVANALRSADKATAVVDATVVAKGGRQELMH